MDDQPSTDLRFRVSSNGPFFMDNNTAGADPEAEATAAVLGFATIDRAGATGYWGNDQVQTYENAEFAWSSPIWIDYTGN